MFEVCLNVATQSLLRKGKVMKVLLGILLAFSLVSAAHSQDSAIPKGTQAS